MRAGGNGSWRWFCALTTVVALLLPAASVAADKPAPAGGFFELGASNGYKIFVLAGSRRADGKGSVALFVGRGHSAAIYSAPAIVTSTSIQADLGSLGTIDVVLMPLGEKETVRSNCSKPLTVEKASYEGTIEFHGERGYTDASATAVPVDYSLLSEGTCGGSLFGEVSGPGLPGASLTIGRKHGGGPLSLEVKKNSKRARTYIEVSETEKRQGIEIRRTTGVLAGPGAFEYDPMLQSAVVEPPAPFSGRGIYRAAAAKSRRWTGNLTVDLPGRSKVPLTGADLPVRLVHAHWSSEANQGNPHKRLLSMGA